jgi:hypothetical protein
MLPKSKQLQIEKEVKKEIEKVKDEIEFSKKVDEKTKNLQQE